MNKGKWRSVNIPIPWSIWVLTTKLKEESVLTVRLFFFHCFLVGCHFNFCDPMPPASSTQPARRLEDGNIECHGFFGGEKKGLLMLEMSPNLHPR